MDRDEQVMKRPGQPVVQEMGRLQSSVHGAGLYYILEKPYIPKNDRMD